MRPAVPLLLLLPMLAGGCIPNVPVPEPVYSPCHALGAGEWKARVEKRDVTLHHPPHRKWRLIVDGNVTVPGEGYDVFLERGPVQKLRDPVQQIMVRTNGPAHPPPDAAPTRVAVHGEFEALKRYGGVTLRCGDGTLGLIRFVPRIPS
ncbi:MAG: hypothetical protein QOH04_752 [Sphingomonadales bacterium]|jgi:hypothetical protein|nr:hypothetical protein [Sphingomonadales bacterium]